MKDFFIEHDCRLPLDGVYVNKVAFPMLVILLCGCAALQGGCHNLSLLGSLIVRWLPSPGCNKLQLGISHSSVIEFRVKRNVENQAIE